MYHLHRVTGYIMFPYNDDKQELVNEKAVVPALSVVKPWIKCLFQKIKQSSRPYYGNYGRQKQKNCYL